MGDPTKQADRKQWWTHITRARILFAAGLAGFTHEMVLGDVAERPIFLLACTAMMGIPSFLPGKNGNGDQP